MKEKEKKRKEKERREKGGRERGRTRPQHEQWDTKWQQKSRGVFEKNHIVEGETRLEWSFYVTG